MRPAALVATLFVVVLAGCTAPIVQDPIGQEGDVAWDSSLNVRAADGLNASERRQVVDRAMARLELLRDLEFDERVPVTVINRSEYLANRSGGGGNETFQRWNDQVWEALFIVGEDRRFHEVQNSTLGSQVLGYYSPGRDEIVIVSDSPTPTLSRGTLVHELVHALQDQRFGFGEGTDTQDLQLAHRSVTEGEANYLQSLYEQRCAGSWSCIDSPASTGGGGGDADSGVLLVILQPYVTGPNFVESIRSRSEWPAVDALYERFPESTEQVLHPEKYPDESPVEVTIPDRSNDEWERFDVDHVGDTLGEASIFAMVEHNAVREGETGRYSFQDEISSGWAGDTLVPYRDGDRYGYVWKTVWDTPGDAREFRAAYADLLAAHGAEERGGGLSVIPPSDPFDDAFRVTRAGSTVTIVNAPTIDHLGDVHRPRG